MCAFEEWLSVVREQQLLNSAIPATGRCAILSGSESIEAAHDSAMECAHHYTITSQPRGDVSMWWGCVKVHFRVRYGHVLLPASPNWPHGMLKWCLDFELDYVEWISMKIIRRKHGRCSISFERNKVVSWRYDGASHEQRPRDEQISNIFISSFFMLKRVRWM